MSSGGVKASRIVGKFKTVVVVGEEDDVTVLDVDVFVVLVTVPTVVGAVGVLFTVIVLDSEVVLDVVVFAVAVVVVVCVITVVVVVVSFTVLDEDVSVFGVVFVVAV